MYLKDHDLVIRRATPEDAQILCQWWSDGKVMEHAGFPNGIYTDVDELKERLKNNKLTGGILIIEINSISVGEMSFRTQDNISEIGIKICNFSYQEKGYGTKAIKMLIKYLFHELKVHKIILDTNLDNTRAQRVYEKIGFQKVAVRRDSSKNQLGVLQSSVDYQLTKEDFLE